VDEVDDIAIIRETMAEQDDEDFTGNGVIDLEKHELPHDTPNESTVSKRADLKLVETSNTDMPARPSNALEANDSA
jgi:hypothetical protein